MRALVSLVCLLLLAVTGCDRHGGATAGGQKAPGFTGATAWLNVDHAVTLGELKGKVVVVDFWTSCCINCLHTLPVLAELEKEHASSPFVVVGVHSAKFDTERDETRLREVILEHGIAHPIAIDGSMKLWEAWKVESWPTLFVLDARGNIVWRTSGEPDRPALERAVAGALDEGKRTGSLTDKPLAGVRREVDHSGPLAYPGRVLALEGGGLAISDTGHNRIVVVTADGAVDAVIGSGLAGFTDGAYLAASFRKPLGLAESGDTLYVADTENHAIRAIDRRAHTVTTLAGTGELGGPPLGAAHPARSQKLRSPWDLVKVGDTLYVALAGSHQIGALSLKDGTMAAFAGDGQERRLDGAGLTASFAQPSGLTTDGKTLYVVDAESSSLRAVSLATHDVHTLVGQDLFVFGDVDGPAPRVRLEHPLAAAWTEGALLVADTYNSKIKRLELGTGAVRTLLGGRDHAVLFEPEGVSLRGDTLYVADTKHHRVAMVDLKTNATRTLEIHGLTAPSSGIMLDAPSKETRAVPRIDLGDVPLASTGSSVLHFEWATPPGTGINEEAPFRVEWTSSDGLATVPTAIHATGAKVQRGFDLTVTPIPGAQGGRLAGQLDVVLCDVSTHLVCVPVRRAIELAFRVATEPGEGTVVKIPMPAAKP